MFLTGDRPRCEVAESLGIADGSLAAWVKEHEKRTAPDARPENHDALRPRTRITELIKSLHDASQTIDLSVDQWSNEVADPSGGPVFCHNDMCLENVVFRDDEAVGLIDFDFAAPGRRVFDIASFARMCVPIGDEINLAKNGWVPSVGRRDCDWLQTATASPPPGEAI